MRTLGIDMSADPVKTAGCEIDWAIGRVGSLTRPVTDERLVAAISAVDVAAIDVPLGWPDAFVDAVVAHRAGAGWPPVSTAPPDDRKPLRFRATDIVAQTGGANPLSVSTERIGVVAMRAARLQHLLGEAKIAVDRSGLSGRVIEAYPAGALRVWKLTSSGYKGSKNAETRRALALATGEKCGGLASAVKACLDDCDDHDLDALICAIVARAARLGHTQPPEPAQLDAAKREGWIHIPTADLETITGAAVRGPARPAR